jgi:hypothetical protein
MDPDDRQMLKHIAVLVEENTTILRKLHRAEKMRRLFRALYWLAVIAMALGAYYLIQPYLEQMAALYGSIRSGVEDVGGANPIDLLNKI